MSVTREFTMVELRDGRIYWDFRTRTPGVGCREVSWSDDPARTFGNIRRDDSLPEPWSHAGLTRVTSADSPDVLVFTNPNRRNASGKHDPELRRELTVRLSFDAGMSWAASRALNHDYASYSDLAVQGATVHCLYENGRETYRDRITYCRFRPAAQQPPGRAHCLRGKPPIRPVCPKPFRS
jgi:hypothetical protein